MDRIEKKKILFLITQSKYGGAQKYLLALARHFLKFNEVQIAVGEALHQDARFFSEAREMGIEPIVLKELIRDISVVKAWDATREIRRLLIKERPDFLHINSSMAGAIGSCAAWLYRFDPLNRTIRVIYTVHGFVFNEPLPPLKQMMYRMIEKVSASWKGGIICVSQYDKDQGLKYKIAADQLMLVIHNGIDPTSPYLSREESRKKLDIPSEVFAVGTIASLYPTKGISYLIDAAQQLTTAHPEMHFYILGEGPLRDELAQKIANLNLTATVHLIGYLPNAAQYATAFDVFALPSLKEGFPYAILEAGAAGLPIVASRVGGIPEIIQHQTDGLLTEAGNAQDLALSIQTLSRDPGLRSSYASAIQKKVRARFTLDRMLSETEKLYLNFYPKTTSSS